jgi:hypothetical protein
LQVIKGYGQDQMVEAVDAPGDEQWIRTLAAAARRE